MEYELVRRKGMRYMRMHIDVGGRVVVRTGLRTSLRAIEEFLGEKRDWIEEQRSLVSVRAHQHPIVFNKARYIQHKEAARLHLVSRVGRLREQFGFTVSGISIRDQKTLWGSCSTSGRLNLNYRLYFLPFELQEYVIVHELCHLLHHNHSKKFWALVESALPDYKVRDRALRRYEYLLHY